MDHAAAHRFVARWAADWNSHDLDRIMSHFADGVVFTSPVAAELLDGCDGTVRGKDALRDYFATGVRRIPDLHFEVLGVYTGVGTIVINYRNQAGQLVSEVLVFDGDLVVAGHGTYCRPAP
ncbi:MAG TPA: nuclear transport factor 2 family protein [Pseudonocardiaceae bacterium]|nr:nuclear transport factor 2 family protein [Pseudonocardiaceae bacterium]